MERAVVESNDCAEVKEQPTEGQGLKRSRQYARKSTAYRVSAEMKSNSSPKASATKMKKSSPQATEEKSDSPDKSSVTKQPAELEEAVMEIKSRPKRMCARKSTSIQSMQIMK